MCKAKIRKTKSSNDRSSHKKPRSSQEVARLTREAAMSSTPLNPKIPNKKVISTTKQKTKEPPSKEKKSSAGTKEVENTKKTQAKVADARSRSLAARGADSKMSIPIQVHRERLAKSSLERMLEGRRSLKNFGESEGPESRVEPQQFEPISEGPKDAESIRSSKSVTSRKPHCSTKEDRNNEGSGSKKGSDKVKEKEEESG